MILRAAALLMALIAPPDTLDLLVGDLAARLERSTAVTNARASAIPRLAITFAGDQGLAPESRQLLRSAIAGRLARTGRYAIEDLSDRLPPLDASALAELRDFLRRDALAALLDLRMTARGGRVFLTCRLIASAAGEDDLFSMDQALTPELSMLLRPDDRTEPEDTSAARLIFSMAAPAGSLAIGAGDTDADGADELFLVTPDALFLYVWRESSLQPGPVLPLAGVVNPAAYNSRIPAARIFSVPQEGQTGIYVAGTPWQTGFVLQGPERALLALPAQPAAALPDGSLLGGEWLPGENSFAGELIPMAASGGDTLPRSLPPFSVLLSARGTVGYCLVAPDGSAWSWDGAGIPRSLPPLPAAPRALCDGGVIWPGMLFAALPGGGDGSGNMVQVLQPHPDRWRLAARFPVSLDITGMAIYNPGGFSPGMVAALGHDERGVATLALYALPATLSWSTR